MHVATTRRHYTGKDGGQRIYETHLLRRSYRDGEKVRNETLSNLSHLPPEAIAAIRAVLAGDPVVVAGERFRVERSRPHGHVAAVHAMAGRLGFPGLLGEPGRMRDVAFALLIARVIRPASKLATRRWWPTPPWPPTSASTMPAGTRCMRRWTGWPTSKTRSKPS
jgi:hypothetical protein